MAARIASTHGEEVIPSPGGFAGMFRLLGYRDPVLVACADGVGTKVKLASEVGRHDTIGIDLVAMSVNDLIVMGARPLFFLDYIAAGTLDPAHVAGVLEGVVVGCEQAGCALLGGETAEMPGVYRRGDFDLAGFCVGCVERDQRIHPGLVEEGDVVLGLASSGVHSNGYSLVRRVLADKAVALEDRPEALGGETVADVLLRPTRIYVKAMQSVLTDPLLRPFVHGVAHITGDGIPGNLPRVLPTGLGGRLDRSRWPVPPVFGWLQELGAITDATMDSVFNRGLGLMVVCAADGAASVREALATAGEEVFDVGRIEPRPEGERVVFEPDS
jgi:phosphoribosylformylglycinamidine cyclo-ligase